MIIDETKDSYKLNICGATFGEGGLAGLIEALQEIQSKVSKKAAYHINIEYGYYDSVDDIEIYVYKDKKSKKKS